MSDPLTVPARDGIEAQNGLNDIFPGDPYPVRDQLKRGLDALRAQASGRGRISSLEIFALTDPLMDILSRCETQPATRPAPSQDAAVVERARNELVIDAYRAMDAIDAIRRWCDGQAYENDTITVAKLRGFLPSLASTRPAEAQAVAEGWRDMASAPKDGTRILLKVVTFAWSSDVCQHVATGDQAIEARWATWMNGDSDGAWHKWCGNARTFSTDGALVPLGWLPLPAASPATGGA